MLCQVFSHPAAALYEVKGNSVLSNASATVKMRSSEVQNKSKKINLLLIFFRIYRKLIFNGEN